MKAGKAVRTDPREVLARGYGDCKDKAVANTLSAVYAAAGNVGAAYNQFLRELKLSHYLALQPEDWYVLGEIAEDCGAPDAAISYYERATNTGQTRGDPLGPYVLAQRRLSALR